MFPEPEQLMSAWALAVTQNDPQGLGEVFAPDAEFVNLFGSIWSGRQAIIDGHSWALHSVLEGSTMQIESVSSRPLSEEAVVMRGVCRRGRRADASVETLAPGTTVLVMVAQRCREGWTAVNAANIAQHMAVA